MLRKPLRVKTCCRARLAFNYLNCNQFKQFNLFNGLFNVFNLFYGLFNVFNLFKQCNLSNQYKQSIHLQRP